jgi:PAS domain S-box-containing protein
MSLDFREIGRLPSLRPYGIAVASVCLALLARQLLDPILGDRVPFSTFFIAIMLIAWWTSIAPTVFALALSSLVALFFYIPPRYTFEFATPADFVGWLVFLAVGLASALISQAHRAAARRAEANAQEAQANAVRLAQEVKQRQMTLAALQNKEAELRDFIENGITPLHWVDRNGNIIWANQAELDLLGYTREEYIGQPIAQFHEDDVVINDMLQRLARDETLQNYEARLRCKDGSIRHVMVNSSVYRENGQFIHTRCFTTDITERKAAEATRARLSAIVQHSDDAIVSKKLDSTIVTWNAGATRIFGYTEEEVVGKSIRILFPPERLPEEDMFLERISRGEHIDHFETERIRKDGQRINISVTLSPIKDDSGNIIGASKIAQDITERKRDERRNHLLLELSTAFSRALTMNQSAEVVVEQALNSLGAKIGVVCLLVDAGTTLEILNLYGLPATVTQEYRRVPLDYSGPLNDAVRANQMVWVETRDEYLRLYPHFRENVLQDGTHSIICLPLQVDEKVIGGISLSFPVEKRRNPKEEAFFRTMAYLCAQSLERARLYEAERRERDLAEALRETVVALSSTWELSEIFDQILANVGRVVQHDLADIMLLEDGVAQVVRSHGYAEHRLVRNESEMRNYRLNLASTPHLKWVTENKCPLIVADTRTDEYWIHLQGLENIRCSLIVPIVIDSEVVGFLNVNSLTPDFFSIRDGERLQVFANHAAVAIRNASLYQRALEIATLEERQRIARDLHDAVSQTLFSANIIAESIPRLWEQQPGKAIAQTQSLHQLTRAAAAEMRVLLFELRPEALVQNNMPYLLTQLGYSLHGRKQIDLSLVIRTPDEQPLPPAVQVAFYRVAQESLNNVLKHGHAKAVRIRFQQTEDQIALVITDNGRGFNTTQLSGGIGLRSMQERAASIHADFRLKSTVGRGTQVRLIWNAPAVSEAAD